MSSSDPSTGRSGAAALAGAATAAAAAVGAYALLRRYPPAGAGTWARTNHRGELLTLLEGPAVPLGATAGAAVTALVLGGADGRRTAWPTAVAGLGALGFGVLDDLRGSGKQRGLRGHLGALAHGEVTTGTVKLAGLAATGLGAALLDRALAGNAVSGSAGPVDVAVNSGLIAGGANLLNLFDLRPGRAAKVALLSAALIAVGGAAARGRDQERLAALAAVAAPAGAALALLPEDLRERAMLGDAGANALGALLGAAAARSLPRPARIGALGVVAALTVASERVSFTRVIAATPPLHWLDLLGRRPAPPAPGTAAAPGAAAAAEGTATAATTAGTGSEPPRRRRPGRHRRVVNGIASSRSGGWLGSLLKTGAPAAP